MKKAFDISVVIVSWNARDYLLACLDSIEKARKKLRIEVIVVDNASADGSADAVEDQFEHVKLIRCGENYGFAKANNIGIRESSGQYVCLINSDVLVLDGCLEDLFAYMEQDRSAGLTGPMVLNGDMTLQKSSKRLPSLKGALLSSIGLDSRNYPPHDQTMETEALSGCFLIARRKAVEEVGLLDERFFFYAEDKDWCHRFRKHGWKVVYYTGAKAIHYGGSSSAKAPVRFYVEMLRANLKYWDKHHGVPSKYAFLIVSVLYHMLRVIRGSVLFATAASARHEAAFKVKRSAACIKWLLSPDNEAPQLDVRKRRSRTESI